jgi:hypothetical protein
MNEPYTKTASNIHLALAFVIVLLSAGSVLAQRNPPPLMTERERMQRENDQRMLGPAMIDLRTWSDAARARRREARLEVSAEIRKDSERLRFFNNEMMRSASAGVAFDPERILKAAGEIKKRAARLRLNLGLPQIEKEERLPEAEKLLDERELGASLLKLDGLIKSLTANPLLNNRHVIDAAQAESAGRDLHEIIFLSDQIRKSVKRLRQAKR